MKPWVHATLPVLAACVLAACAGTGQQGGGGRGAPSPATVSPAASTSPSAVSPPACGDRALAGMSVNQRIGQLFLLGLAGDRLGSEEVRLIREDNVGSVWFTETSGAGAGGIAAVAASVQAEATTTATAGVGFFVAANQEGGVIQALRGPGFAVIPSALDQGALSPAVVEEDSVKWARELSAAGVNLNFAPVADVVPPGFDAQNQPIGVLRRGFGHDPASVGDHVVAFVRGMHQGGVSVTLKHFPGLGRVTGNTDFTPATDGSATAPDTSFARGIANGADFVMVAVARYDRIDPQRLAAFSPTIVTGMLRDSLGFSGVIVSDDLGATAAVAGVPAGERATRFLDAGGDLIVSKTTAPAEAMVAALRARAAADPAFRDRVTASARRVLAAKEARGLLRC